ncbi:hypothetical protein [Streptomyces synnematoformans]|uniref:Lipoprotein n=1 Tax=Streptomyces synnematoformans TaxID=415721 RepID=A0ABN2YJQ9_9ACTN
MKGLTGHTALRTPSVLSVLLVLPLAASAGCGIDDSGPAAAGPPASGLAAPDSREAAVTHVYFYAATGLERVSRSAGAGEGSGGTARLQRAMDLLVQGTSRAERDRGLVSFVPENLPAPRLASRARGGAEVTVLGGWRPAPTALRQIVCTAADAVGDAQDSPPEDIGVRVQDTAGRALATERCVR